MRAKATASPAADALTAAAIGILSGVLMMIAHEALGHGVATLLFGAHIVRVTSVYESWSGVFDASTKRLISAAGIASNLFWGVIALVALRQMRPRSAAARYFLWYFGHATLFMGSGYMVFSALTGLGDVQQAIAGLPLPILWRAGVAVLGIIIYRAALIDAARTLDVWAGNDARAVRLRNLALVPYLALGVAATLSGLLSPDGALAGFFWSAAATFGAGTGFAFLPLMLQDPSTSTHPAALDLERSPGWIAAGGIALIVLYAVLAPGVPR